jgi:hypothetical protein
VPSGCGVRLNGIALGVTPYVSEDVATGDYRAQVECTDPSGEPPSRHGRIHRIRLAEGASTVRVDVRFDSAVRTDTALRLLYATQADADAHRLEDAVTAAGTIGAAEVWLLSMEEGDIIRLDRVSVSRASVLASVRTHTTEGLAPAIVSLSSGVSQDRTGAAPVSMAPWGAPPMQAHVDVEGDHDGSRVTHARADWELAVGATLGVIGIAGYAASFGMLYVDEVVLGHQATQPLITDPDYLSRRNAWTSWEPPVLAASIAGGALVTAALPFVMTDEDGTPWWSWLIGGVGLAAIGAGVGIIASAQTCGTNRPTDACVAGTAQADDGAAVIAMGAPLSSVPIVYLIRSALGTSVTSGVSPSVSASNIGASLSLGGTW